MNGAEQLYYLGPVQWAKVVKSIRTLALMAFQSEVQWLWRHTISKVICSDRHWRPVLCIGQSCHWLLLRMKFTVTSENSHEHIVCLYSQRTQERPTVPFPHSPVSFNSMTISQETTGHLGSRPHFPFNSQLPDMLTLSSSSLPNFSIELILFGNFLDLRSICHCPPLPYFWIFSFSFFSDFSLPFCLSLFH